MDQGGTTMHEEYLKEKGYKELEEFNEKQQGALRRILGTVNLVLTKPYIKIFQKVVTIAAEDNGETLWETHIAFASFVLFDTDNKHEEMYLDHFFLPLRPFHIRSVMEKNELQNLISTVWDDFNEIEEHFDLPDMLEKGCGEA